VSGGGLTVALLLGFALTLANPGEANAAGFKGRKFYLAVMGFDGSQALTACVEKYHMASIWEILDVTTLSYALEVGPPFVSTAQDQGSGPPTNNGGWVRTGYNNSTDATPGEGNCNGWMSNNGGHYGTVARLVRDWTTAGTLVAPWIAQPFTCDLRAPVWCVADK
jgi:hypothetical protein